MNILDRFHTDKYQNKKVVIKQYKLIKILAYLKLM